MMKLLRQVVLVLALTLTPLSAFATASVSLTPVSPSVVVGGSTQQFDAVTDGLTPATVTWSVAGVAGGSATAGTVSSTGLYTSPATIPGQNPVQITATSTANTAYSASTEIDILAKGPTLSSVSPASIAVGSFTVTLTGKGFLTGAQVLETSGTTVATLTNTSLTSTQIVATGYQGDATSAAFKVKNPGTGWSNSITITVTEGTGSTDYTLTVVNGSGGGTYPSTATVTITANAPPAGQTFTDWTGATVANAKSASTTLVMPAADTTVTANYTGSGPTKYALTVDNGTGTGSYVAGTVVNISADAPPAGQVFKDWTGATVASATSPSTTLSMPSASTTVTANYAAAPPPPVPFPVSGHPRLWITPADVTRLQGWAVPSNTVWNALTVVINKAVYVHDTYYFPKGVAANPYPDPGDIQGYGTLVVNSNLTSNSESWAFVLAFASLVDPSAANRSRDAKDAHDLLMYAMNLAAKGPNSGQPFQDPMFPIYNRSNLTGHQWGLIVDWIYPSLTASDKATIRKVFMLWCSECENPNNSGQYSPQIPGVINSLQLLPNDLPYRYASNNYFLGHAREMTTMALSFDPADDPPLDATEAPSVIGNTLRSYIGDVNGAWLYEEFAMMGDPAVAAKGLGVPNNPTGAGFGLASGGLPPEGMLYGHSFGFILGQLLALQTAGFNNTKYAGQQVGLIGAPVWDRFVHGFMSSLTPTSIVPPSEPYLGPVYEQMAYGDLLRLWVTPDAMIPFALVDLIDHENTGSTVHDDAARWFATKVVPGGYINDIADPYTWSVDQSLLYFMLMDPSAPAPTDPRPTWPTYFYDPPAGRIVAHTDWSLPGTFFDYRASWITINHQDGDAGQFEFYRNGEWLTKGMSNYDNNNLGENTPYHNTLSLQNWSPYGTPYLLWFQDTEWADGSQYMEGTDAGDPTTVTSTGPGYVYASSDLTNLYNLIPDPFYAEANASDVTLATRSILWLNNDYIVIYDRATTKHSDLFKTFSLCLIDNPEIDGNISRETLASGQQLFTQTLLPQNAVLSSALTAPNLDSVADLEPAKYTLTVQDPTNPADIRFLHVLQGSDAGKSMTVATYMESTSGDDFDGAVFGTSAVFFPQSATAAFAGTTLTIPSTVTQLMVAGLVPSGTYSATEHVSGSSDVVKITPDASGKAADSAGLLTIAP